MSDQNLNVFLPIFLFCLLGGVIAVAGHLVTVFLMPKQPGGDKEVAYECGEQPTGTAWSAFNARFYVIGLIFIIFDVESVLMFPAAAVFKDFQKAGEAGPVVVVFLLFISVLVEGLVYCWKKGDLDWVRSFVAENNKK